MNGRKEILEATRFDPHLLFSSFGAQNHVCCGAKSTDALQPLAERAFTNPGKHVLASVPAGAYDYNSSTYHGSS